MKTMDRLIQDTSTAENELTNIALVRNKFAHSHAMIDRGEIDCDEKHNSCWIMLFRTT